uniref:Putative secreted protein n=1 Tax=Ixodes ricinus TaxID=34613 RepID=A0A6B0TRD4_IXORI
MVFMNSLLSMAFSVAETTGASGSSHSSSSESESFSSKVASSTSCCRLRRLLSSFRSMWCISKPENVRVE